jgi:hypothetical protein
MRLDVVEPRSCGGCTECCETLAIAELNKPAHQECVHRIVGVGCAIYESRPHVCREFRCAWLQGTLKEMQDDALRPDRTGVLFAWVPDTFFGTAPVLTAYERFAGAFDAEPAKSVIETLSARQLVILLGREGGHRINGPQDKVRAVQERIVKLVENLGNAPGAARVSRPPRPSP